ncbi:hypothetical protein GW17_00037993 [Ensete ventricosum]|nr:hypothetical protein GW17_00037993 [Ensete ventricosum]
MPGCKGQPAAAKAPCKGLPATCKGRPPAGATARKGQPPAGATSYGQPVGVAASGAPARDGRQWPARKRLPTTQLPPAGAARPAATRSATACAGAAALAAP